MTELTSHYSNFYLKPIGHQNEPIVFHNDVITVGRSESCDVKIDSAYLSHVHASIFYKDGEFFLTDLNSTNGTFVNKEKVKVKRILIGDYVSFSSITYQLMPLVLTGSELGEKTLESNNPFNNAVVATQLIQGLNNGVAKLPPIPITESLPSSDAPAHDEVRKNAKPITHTHIPEKKAIVKDKDFAPSLPASFSNSSAANFTRSIFNPIKPSTPLDILPGLQFSGFIFEEKAEGEAFIFSKKVTALEITTFANDYVLSVDYYDEKMAPLKLAGESKPHSLFCPVLNYGKVSPFLSFEQNNFLLDDEIKQFGFSYLIFSKNGLVHDPGKINDKIVLSPDYVVTISFDYLQMVIKFSSSPPKTTIVPFLLFDTLLNKIFFSLFPVYLALMVSILMLPEKERDFDEEKIELDRLVFVNELPEIKPTPLPVAKVEAVSDPRPKEPVETPPVQQKVDNNKLKETNKMVNTAISQAPVENKQIKKIVIPPTVVAKNTQTEKTTSTTDPSVKPVLVSDVAVEPAPPKLNIKSLQNKIANNLSNSGVGSSVVSKNSSSDIEGARSSEGVVDGTKVNDVAPLKAEKVGSVNVLGKQQGSLSSGKSIPSTLGGDIGVFDATGGRKVILGIMDPQEIQNILRRYIPQFQFCYEQELESLNSKIATTLVLDFSINAQGRVVDDSYSSKNMEFSSRATSCFSGILRGIQFSKPKGGGTVKVKQPINMEPRF